jgi:hypothetical protein
MISATRLQQVHERSRLNRQSMAPGAACRCFYCLQAFPVERISRWTDDDKTALCPICGVDSVLSSSSDGLSDALIQQLHAAYFGSSRQYTDDEWQKDLAEQPEPRRKAIVDGR